MTESDIYRTVYCYIKGGEFGPYQQRRFGQNTGIYRTNRRPVWAILTVVLLVIHNLIIFNFNIHVPFLIILFGHTD